jgi:hypothetical protein
MAVRPFVEDDIPQVAQLYWKVMRGRKGRAPTTLYSSIRQLYFANPWLDKAIPSLVYEEKGKVIGFLGVIPRKMSLRGQSIRVAFGGNFAVDPEFRTTMAGLRLLSTYLAGGQDLSQTDSANDISRALLVRLGFTTILPLSIHWLRPLRPARLAAHAAGRLLSPGLAASLELAAWPFCAPVDAMASRVRFSPFRQTEPRLQAAELDTGTLLSCMAEFRAGRALWPEYDAASLEWLLDYMEQTKAHGNLRKLILRDGKGKIAGWYVYYWGRGKVAEVVQMGGPREFTKDVLDHLFHDAWSRGAIALHGVVDPQLMSDLSDKNCFFTCRGGWTVAHSRNRELLQLLNNGDALLSRLDGEWCLALGP